MANIHGSRARIFIDDQSGTCMDMQGDTNSITLNFSKNNPEATTMGDNTVQRIDGLRDASIDVTSIWNSGASSDSVVGLIDEMYAGSLTSRVQYAPGGCSAGCPIYTASMVLANAAVNSPVDGVTTLNYSLQIATGSMTAACQS